MTTARCKLLLCNCNRTMAVDAKTIANSLELEIRPVVATELCRSNVSSFEAAVKTGEDTLVACTQEAPLFSELHKELKGTGEIRFVNIRENAGWSAEGAEAAPKMAALLALGDMPDPEPVAAVAYSSAGEVLIVGPGAVALDWAERLASELTVSVLLTDRAGELPSERRYPTYSGRNVAVKGHLGAFEVTWEQSNPIDLDLCTRCGACVKACPEQAIDFSFQIDMDRCQSHRKCVTACGEIKAISFDRAENARHDRFDLVLDLSPVPLLRMTQPPQGYFAPGRDALEQALAANQLLRMTGEFEKPRFFVYNERICAHSRSGITGCTRCIDVCSTAAITSNIEGNRIVVDPHLCMGCGGCATVCPSGAMSYAYPRVADTGTRVRAALKAYRSAGGRGASILFHNTTDGRALISALARRGRGMPAAIIPLEVLHVGSLGPDLLLGALALGAAEVTILAAGSEAREYLDALEREIAIANAIVSGLGYSGMRLRLVCASDTAALDAALWIARQDELGAPATFNLTNEKRRTLEFAIDHLAKQAPARPQAIPLASGAAFGRVEVNRKTCTLCMACVGSCPASALVDSKETPQLRFVERNCIQCGLCVETCPEDALSLEARLSLAPEAKTAVVLHEAEPFDCVRCSKPFGTRQMIDNMMARLTSHSMFGNPAALNRLQMCADCRVLDMMEKPDGANVFEYPSVSVKDV